MHLNNQHRGVGGSSRALLSGGSRGSVVHSVRFGATFARGAPHLSIAGSVPTIRGGGGRPSYRGSYGNRSLGNPAPKLMQSFPQSQEVEERY